MNTKQQIQEAISKALKQEFDYEIEPDQIHLERPQDESHGDWATNIAMTLSKELKQNPRQIAEQINSKLITPAKGLPTGQAGWSTFGGSNYSLTTSIAGPGFINFKLPEKSYKSTLEEILEKKEHYGNNQRLKGKRIMVEFAHPNPFKSFHIGHLRNIILGESLVRLLESQGAQIIRANYQGDVGMHIAKCIWALKEVDEKDYPQSADEKTSLLGKCYAKGASAFEENEQAQAEIKKINKQIYTKDNKRVNKLWELGRAWSLEKFHEIYKRVYTTFEREYFESETLNLIQEPMQKAEKEGIFKRSQGALIFDGEKFGLDTRVFENSQGLPTYEGKELGLAVLKTKEYGTLDLHIHNVAVEHKSFFAVTFKVKELLWPEVFKGHQYHNAYEFVGLKKGKMSSRKGNVILGNDILNEAHEKVKAIVSKRQETKNIDDISEKIAVGAVKWSFLKISPFKYLAFDINESISFEGDSGPYIQYAYTRIQSILKKQKPTNKDLNKIQPNDLELALLKQLERFPETVTSASLAYSPNLICSYLFELAQRFNSFYKKHQILKEKDTDTQNFRLMLAKATGIIIENGLELLGIKTVEQM